MSNFLATIYQEKLIEVRNAKKLTSLTTICQQLKEQNSINSQKCQFDKNISNQNNSEQGLFFWQIANYKKQNRVALICEAKKASPSKGIIRKDFEIKSIINQFEQGGAACISVLTDEKYFLGSNDYLQIASKITKLPIIRKDFIVDEYQIYQAKLFGASAILLIVAMFRNNINKIKELERVAFSLGLSVLIEIHDEEELAIAKEMTSKLIGVNNRNLKTMEVDLSTSIRLSQLIDDEYIMVAESGINNKKDIELLHKSRFDAFLIGESLMKQKDIALAIKNLLL